MLNVPFIPNCKRNEVLIHLKRSCEDNPERESFEIYEGARNLPNDPIYKQSSCYANTFYFCINPVEHTIVLQDLGTDGWNGNSYLLLKNGNVSQTYKLDVGGRYMRLVFALTPILPIPTTPPIPTLPVPECSDGQVLIEAIRTCGLYIYDESFSIYEGVYDYHP